jgi:PhnB protein
MVMHIEYPILGGHKLMATDALEELGFKLNVGNNHYIMLEPDSKADADRIFKALSSGGKVEIPLEDMFWGAYYGSLADKYGVQWMINVSNS